MKKQSRREVLSAVAFLLQKVNEHRETHNLSLQTMCNEMANHITPSYLNRLLNGERTNPSFETVCVLIDYLDLNPMEVFNRAIPQKEEDGAVPTINKYLIEKGLSEEEAIVIIEKVFEVNEVLGKYNKKIDDTPMSPTKTK